MKVLSNKNENNYKIKEWYIKDSDDYKFRIETNNDENNFIYLGNKNSIYIKSEQQISSFNLQNYNLKRNNLLSISSVVEILYNLELLCKKCDGIDKQCCKITFFSARYEPLRYVYHPQGRRQSICKKPC